jgi:hypothetical protein
MSPEWRECQYQLRVGMPLVAFVAVGFGGSQQDIRHGHFAVEYLHLRVVAEVANQR